MISAAPTPGKRSAGLVTPRPRRTAAKDLKLLTEEDKQWIREQLEEVKTALLTEFYQTEFYQLAAPRQRYRHRAPSPFMTISQVGEVLKLSRTTLMRMAETGELMPIPRLVKKSRITYTTAVIRKYIKNKKNGKTE